MISKLKQIIESLFGIRRDQPLPIKRLQKKQRFLVIDDPYEPKALRPKEQKQRPSVMLPMPKNAEQLMNIYRINCGFEQNDQTRQQAKQNEDLFLNLRQLDTVIREIERKQKFILAPEKALSNVGSMLSPIKEAAEWQDKERELYRKYMRIVEDTISLKYTGERIDYPDISFQKFKQVAQIWNTSEAQGQNLVPGYDHLRYCHLRLLGPGGWLNDEIITEYINQMNLKLSQQQGNNFVIFNSLKAASLFEKTDYKKLEKVLERQKVNRKTTLLLAIHKVNHWLFLKMEDAEILIYDSMCSLNINSYLGFPLINKIVKFAQHFYQAQPKVEKATDFPQQTNGYDCGMMMLCGMKDLVRDRAWTFSQNDMTYKRVLLTRELLDRQITGFEYFHKL